MPNRIDHCPSCDGELEIRELYCPSCDITIRGRFPQEAGSAFSKLNGEQEAFLRLFVLSRGNLSDVERSLGVSYPTVRGKLDDLIAAISETREESANGSRTTPTPEPLPTRADILQRVADGRLSTDEGMALLKQLADS